MDLSLAALVECLSLAKEASLPGRLAQDRMLSDFRRRREAAPQAGTEWRRAAVLVLLYPDGAGRTSLPLVERGEGVRHHRGEMGLPGGGIEDGESATEAALREAREELCLDDATAGAIRVLCALSPLCVPSGFEMQPFVGWLPFRPAMSPREGEIAGIVEAAIEDLLDPAKACEEDRCYEDQTWRVPFFWLGGRKVWGATAMVLAELAAMIGPR